VTVVSYLAWRWIDLVRGNAIKVFTVVLLTLLSLVAFAGNRPCQLASGLALGLATCPEASQVSAWRGHAGTQVARARGDRDRDRVCSDALDRD
jgi:hypothetical protein